MVITQSTGDNGIGRRGQLLLTAISDKRRAVESYARSANVRRKRLLNTTVFAGAIAATLTAGPALGGRSFSDRLTDQFGLSSPVWQLLCAAATVCSLAAAVATQLAKSHNLDERIASAHRARARLEWLEVALAAGQITYANAASEYGQSVESVGFIDAQPRT
jgi:cytochrome bd-type quinol oxidase subunit 2